MGHDHPYPGSTAGPDEVIRLAEAYREGARVLLPREHGTDWLAAAPARLCAVHAIELYLNAFLLGIGREPREIRLTQHNLVEKSRTAREGGLVLKQRTVAHLREMMDEREYLVLRYEPGMARLQHVTKLWATLDEIRRKVTEMVGGEPVWPDLLPSGSEARPPATI